LLVVYGIVPPFGGHMIVCVRFAKVRVKTSVSAAVMTELFPLNVGTGWLGKASWYMATP
jgi:hypothetical protein